MRDYGYVFGSMLNRVGNWIWV